MCSGDTFRLSKGLSDFEQPGRSSACRLARGDSEGNLHHSFSKKGNICIFEVENLFQEKKHKYPTPPFVAVLIISLHKDYIAPLDLYYQLYRAHIIVIHVIFP
jgi:hypothetical protein